MGAAETGDDALQGYVADAAYPVQQHPDLDPTRQVATLLATGRKHRALGAPFRYLELGCGSGFSLAAFAAAQPRSQFVGVDINPDHIEALDHLVAEAQVSNLSAICAGFDALDPAAFGKVQVAAAHGVWSWVSTASRERLVALLGQVLDDGGLFYLSYNALPGMAAIAPLRRLLMLAPQAGATTLERVQEATAFVGEIAMAGSAFLETEAMRPRLEALLSDAPGYVAHEYFNRDWTAFYQDDVAVSLAEAGLSFAAASRIADNIDAARFTTKQRALLAQTAPTQQEVLKDFLSNRPFRADIFVRGDRALSPRTLAQQFASARLVCAARPEALPTDAPPRYARIIATLSEAPATLAEVQAAAGVRGVHTPEAVQAAVVDLMAMELVALCLPRSGQRERKVSCDAFNAMVLRRAGQGDFLPGLVSPVTGGVLALSGEDLAALASTSGPSGALTPLLRRLDII